MLSIGRQTPPTNVDAIDHGTWFPLGPYCRAIWVFVHCASRDKMLHRHWHKSTSLQQQQQCGFDSASTGRIKDRNISVHCKHAKEQKKQKKTSQDTCIHKYIYTYVLIYIYHNDPNAFWRFFLSPKLLLTWHHGRIIRLLWPCICLKHPDLMNHATRGTMVRISHVLLL